jgi:DNA-binding phage protein
MRKLKQFEDLVIEDLKNNPKYLQYFIKESLKDYKETNDITSFLKDLKYIAEAKKGSLTNISKEISCTRQTLYNIFNNKNFTFNNFQKLLASLDMNVSFNFKH